MTIANLLLSACRERHLRKLDPNVPDENYSFVSTNSYPSSGATQWSSVDGVASLVCPTGGGKIAKTTAENLSCVWSGGGYENNVFSMQFSHPNFTTTNEVYIRAILWLPVASSTPAWWNIEKNPIITIADNNSKDVKLTLTWEWNGDISGTRDNSRVLKLVYKDASGTLRTLRSEYVFPSTGATKIRNVDIKVFIPVNGEATLTVGPLGAAPILTLSGAGGKGFDDNQPAQTFAINSHDGFTPSNSITRFYRVGVGNRISTARP